MGDPAARVRAIHASTSAARRVRTALGTGLFEQRAEGAHPSLSRLGPDLLRDPFDSEEALRRLRHPSRADRTIAEALLDQRALAGIGNVYKSEVLFIEEVDPFGAVGDLDGALVPGERTVLLGESCGERLLGRLWPIVQT